MHINNLPYNDKTIEPITEKYGYEGYGKFMAVLNYCEQFGIVEIDIQDLIKALKTNKRGAETLLPLFQECLPKVWDKFTQSLPKVYPKFGESLPKLEAQNPHGSTHAHDAQYVSEININNHTYTHTGPDSSSSDENIKLGLEGMAYMASLNSPNHTNIGWMSGYLRIKLADLEAKAPDIPKQDLMALWRDTCDTAVAKNGYAPKWFKTTFDNKISAWKPNQSENVVEFKKPEEKGKEAKALLEFPYIQDIYSQAIMPSSAYEWREDYPSALYINNQAIPYACLKGLEDITANG